MNNDELINTDPDDIDELLLKVETSFDIKFANEELAHIKSFGQLCDYIADKIQLENSENCTNQQAFYKLRESLSAVLNIDRKLISPDSLLIDILPNQHRRLIIDKLEKYIGFEINILRPPHWVTWILSTIFIASFFSSFLGFLIAWQIGLASIIGLILSCIGFIIANNIGNELDLQTVGQVVEKIAREHYLKSRRNPNTFNKKEIEKILTDLFATDLDLDRSKLTRETEFA